MRQGGRWSVGTAVGRQGGGFTLAGRTQWLLPGALPPQTVCPEPPRPGAGPRVRRHEPVSAVPPPCVLAHHRLRGSFCPEGPPASLQGGGCRSLEWLGGQVIGRGSLRAPRPVDGCTRRLTPVPCFHVPGCFRGDSETAPGCTRGSARRDTLSRDRRRARALSRGPCALAQRRSLRFNQL